jgi:hypothetical protein
MLMRRHIKVPPPYPRSGGTPSTGGGRVEVCERGSLGVQSVFMLVSVVIGLDLLIYGSRYWQWLVSSRFSP